MVCVIKNFTKTHSYNQLFFRLQQSHGEPSQEQRARHCAPQCYHAQKQRYVTLGSKVLGSYKRSGSQKLILSHPASRHDLCLILRLAFFLIYLLSLFDKIISFKSFRLHINNKIFQLALHVFNLS